MQLPFDLETFVHGYIEAMLFADCGEEDQPPADYLALSDDLQSRATADCESFLWRTYYFIDADDMGRAGNYFWYTRNGHGVGFWDGSWPKYGDTLDGTAKTYGPVDVYTGDDGKTYMG